MRVLSRPTEGAVGRFAPRPRGKGRQDDRSHVPSKDQSRVVGLGEERLWRASVLEGFNGAFLDLDWRWCCHPGPASAVADSVSSSSSPCSWPCTRHPASATEGDRPLSRGERLLPIPISTPRLPGRIRGLHAPFLALVRTWVERCSSIWQAHGWPPFRCSGRTVPARGKSPREGSRSILGQDPDRFATSIVLRRLLPAGLCFRRSAKPEMSVGRRGLQFFQSP